MGRSFFVGGLALALAVFGCSSGSGGGGGGGGQESGDALTCAWLEGPDNCWQNAVNEAYEDCAIAEGSEGTLSSDNLSCTYPNGDTDIYGGENGHPGFYVEAKRGGSLCFQFEDPSPGQTGQPVVLHLTTRSGEVVSTSALDSMSIQCPDGRTYSASGMGMLSLYSCKQREYADGSSMIPFPGYIVSPWNLGVLPTPVPGPNPALTDCY